MISLTKSTDEDFVDALYRNLLGREPDAEGRRAHLAGLKRGATRIALLEAFLGSAEFAASIHGHRFAPPGHFYSPLPSAEDVERHRRFDWHPASLPGIDLNEAGQLALLDRLAAFHADQPFSAKPANGLRYGFDNPAYSYGDALLLHAMIRHLRPRRIIEVGSGHSSCVTMDTCERFLGNAVELTFVEPYPQLLRRLMKPGDEARHRIIEQGLQHAPVGIFASLEPGDILFVDSSHVSKLGSDVNHLFFEILPALRPGVFVHIHDILYPFEYPMPWIEEGRAWSENYLLRAFLQYNETWRIELFSTFMVGRHRAWFEARMPLALRNFGGQFWMSRVR